MPETGDSIRPLFLPRGIGDAATAKGYVSDAAGHVVALALADGAGIWRSRVLARPVLAAGGRVFAVRPAGPDAPSVLWLELIDARSGRLEGERALDLSVASPGATGTPDLDLSATLAGDVFRLRWRRPDTYAGGAPAPQHVRERFATPTSGVFEYHLASRALSARPTPNGADESPRLPSAPYRRDETWRYDAWPAGRGLARLDLDESRNPPVLRLELWNSRGAQRLRAADLLEGRALEPTVTPAGDHLFLRRTSPPGDRWLVYEVASGRRIASLPYDEGSRLPVLLGDRVLYLVWPSGSRGGEAVIHAVDLASGRRLWDYSLSEPAARRPPPLPR